MSAEVVSTPQEVPGEHGFEPISQEEYRRQTANNRLGLWLFLLSDAFVFGGLFISKFYLYGAAWRPEVDQLVGFVVTAMLLISSFFANRGEILMKYGDIKGYTRNTLITMVLGTLFLIGVVGIEWQIAPHGPSESALWSLFYTMTGFHAFHVLTGLLFLFIVWRNTKKGLYTTERHWPVEAAATYWHFVDLVWIFFYPALYLIGQPPL